MDLMSENIASVDLLSNRHCNATFECAGEITLFMVGIALDV